MSAAQAPPPVRVLYVAGSGRSGSTVITTVLGQLPGCFAAGELRYLWERGVAHDHTCGWVSVQRVPGLDRRDEASARRGGCGRRARHGQRLLTRLRILRLPLILARRAGGRAPVPFHADDSHIARLYRAIADETGASFIVDSSKLPPYGLLLRSRPASRCRCFTGPRPRATAWSWQRHKDSRDGRPHVPARELEELPAWLVWNLLGPTCGAPAAPGVPGPLRGLRPRASHPAPVARMLGATAEIFRWSPRTRCASPRPTRWPATPTGNTGGGARATRRRVGDGHAPARPPPGVGAHRARLAALGYPLMPTRHTQRTPGPAPDGSSPLTRRPPPGLSPGPSPVGTEVGADGSSAPSPRCRSPRPSGGPGKNASPCWTSRAVPAKVKSPPTMSPPLVAPKDHTPIGVLKSGLSGYRLRSRR